MMEKLPVRSRPIADVRKRPLRRIGIFHRERCRLVALYPHDTDVAPCEKAIRIKVEYEGCDACATIISYVKHHETRGTL